MKIVRIIARLNVGGPARHVVWLTAGLRGRAETLLVTGRVPPEEDDMGYFAETHGVAPYVIPEMSREISPKDAVTILKLYRLFLRERPDIVHTHTAKAGTVGRIAGLAYKWLTPSALLGRPRKCIFVHTYHGHVFHSYYGPIKTRAFLTIERILARIATDRIIVISPQQFREIHSEFHVGREDQFEIVPLGLDLGAFENANTRRNVLRRELACAEDDVLIGIVGRLTEIKNHKLFLNAAAHVKRHRGGIGPRIRYLIIGDGGLREALATEARVLGIERDVEFLGTRSDPENFYPALDLVALTSFNEGTPLTLIEAMANGCPCAATGVGGVVDLLGSMDHGLEKSGYSICERGLLTASGDVEGFSAALEKLIDEPAFRHRLGLKGQQFVNANFSRERLLNDVENLYTALLNEKTGKKFKAARIKPDARSSDLIL